MLPIIRRMRRKHAYSINLFRKWKQILNLMNLRTRGVPKRIDWHVLGGFHTLTFYRQRGLGNF